MNQLENDHVVITIFLETSPYDEVRDHEMKRWENEFVTIPQAFLDHVELQVDMEF